ncbi:MAG: hypothetical protein U7126_18935 [Microcoleus sp.]
MLEEPSAYLGLNLNLPFHGLKINLREDLIQMLLNLESGAGRWGERAQGERAQGNRENLFTESNRRLTGVILKSQISNRLTQQP